MKQLRQVVDERYADSDQLQRILGALYNETSIAARDHDLLLKTSV